MPRAEAEAVLGDIVEELDDVAARGGAPRWPRLWCEWCAWRYAWAVLLSVRVPLSREMRWAWRGVRARRWRSVLIVALLGTALAANVLMFIVSDAVLFRPFPYRDVEHLVEIRAVPKTPGGYADRFVRPPLADAWRAQTDLFVGFEAYHLRRTVFVQIGETAEAVDVCNVTPGLLRVLGVEPRWGRTLAAGDERDASLQVVVVSEAFARRTFGPPERILGQRIETTSMPLLVVGVMGSDFAFPDRRIDMWRALDPEGRLASDAVGVNTIARVDASRSVAATRELVHARSAAVGEAAGIPGYAATIAPVAPALVPTQLRGRFYVLLGGAACLLLTACASVIGLEMAGAMSRARAYAIQTALGASRASIIRGALLEGGMLLGVAALAAAGITLAATHTVGTLLPAYAQMTANAIDLDARACLFLAATTCVTWLVVSIPVASYGTRTHVVQVIGAHSRTVSASRPAVDVRRWLTAIQVAIAVCLVIVGGLYVRSYVALLSNERGFDSDNLIQIGFRMPPSSYRRAYERNGLVDELVARAEAVPGVLGATGWPAPPSLGNSPSRLRIEVDNRAPDPLPVLIGANRVPSSYFSVVGVRLKAGRVLRPDDAPTAAVIPESFARRFWPGQDPIGHRFRLFPHEPWSEVVGVVSDIATDPRPTAAGPERFFYFAPRIPPAPLSASDSEPSEPEIDTGATTMFADVTVRLDSLARAPAVLRGVQNVDRRLSAELEVVDDRYALQFSDMRLLVVLVGAFGGLAFLVAMVGVYGVMAYLVEGRTREIGIRIALGADARSVVRLVLGTSTWLVLAGALAGLGAAAVVSRVVRAQLFDVSATDPATYVSVVALVVVMSLLATWHPAQRAASIDPAVTLRAE